jgi:hypothetical protein
MHAPSADLKPLHLLLGQHEADIPFPRSKWLIADKLWLSLSSIAKWVLSLERLEPSFYLSIIIEVVRIVGWVRPQWHRIHDILTISR